MTIKKINAIFENIKNEMEKNFSNKGIYSFFCKATVQTINDNKIVILVKNKYIEAVLKKNYVKNLQSLFFQHIKKEIQIDFTTEYNIENIPKKDCICSNINTKLTFDNYIVGDFNSNIYKIINLIFKKSFNQPILILGTTGSGKSHLLNAIVIKLYELFPEKTLCFFEALDLISKIYEAISNNDLEKLKQQIQKKDFLLVDDIQFFENRSEFNEVFFSIFDLLLKQNKQIILTIDKLPQYLKVEQRVISRLNSCLIIKFDELDFVSVEKIINTELNKFKNKINLNKNKIEKILKKAQNDIRILKSELKKYYYLNLNTKYQNNQTDINNYDKYLIDNQKSRTDKIIDNICFQYSIEKTMVLSRKRNKNVSFVRKLLMYILRHKYDYSYKRISEIFSNRSRATIIEALKYIEKKLYSDKNLYNFVNNYQIIY